MSYGTRPDYKITIKSADGVVLAHGYSSSLSGARQRARHMLKALGLIKRVAEAKTRDNSDVEIRNTHSNRKVSM